MGTRLEARNLDRAGRLLLLSIEASKYYPFQIYYLPQHGEVSILWNPETRRGVKLSAERDYLLILPLVPAENLGRKVFYFLPRGGEWKYNNETVNSIVNILKELAEEYSYIPILGAAAYDKDLDIDNEYSRSLTVNILPHRYLFGGNILGSFIQLIDELIPVNALLSPERYPVIDVDEGVILYGKNRYRLCRNALYDEKRRHYYTTILLEQFGRAADAVFRELFNRSIPPAEDDVIVIEDLDTSKLEKPVNELEKIISKMRNIEKEHIFNIVSRYINNLKDVYIRRERLFSSLPTFDIYLLAVPSRGMLDLYHVGFLGSTSTYTGGARYVLPLDEWSYYSEQPLERLMRELFLFPVHVPVL